MRTLIQSVQYKFTAFIFIFFILNIFVQISCRSNYVLCPDEISACANNQVCCQKGTGYRCCPDFMVCCKDGTYCCTPGEFSRTIDLGLFARDSDNEYKIVQESERSIFIEKEAGTKCSDYLLEILINPIKDLLINHNNNPSISLISGIKSLLVVSEATSKLHEYCSVDTLELVKAYTKEIKELSNLKTLILKGNLQKFKQNLTSAFNKLQEYFLTMSQA